MSNVKTSAEQLIGNTPLLKLGRIVKKEKLKVNLLGKLEYLNLSGSVKDRVAASIIEDAEKKGILKAGTRIIEPTSGNTGIALAAISAAKGYPITIVMPDSMSVERRKLMQIYGADLVLTEGAKGMKGAIAKAEELHRENSDSIIAGQFINPANPKIHLETTGPEIWEDTEGKVDILVAGIGTGGTITGAGEYLKKQNPHIKVVAVEPEGSPVLSKGVSGSHKIQGIGAGFVPDVLDIDIFDEIITVADKDAFSTSREIAKTEGIFVGISSGAALHAALSIARQPENEGKTIVIILPDSGDRYLSTALMD